MKCALLFLLFCFSCGFAHAAGGDDSLALKALIKKGDDVAAQNPTEAHRLYAEVVRRCGNDAALRYYKADALYGESFLLFGEEKYQQSIDKCTEAADIFAALNRKEALAKCYNQIGLCWQYRNDYAQSLHFLFRALRISEDLKNIPLTGRIYTNIGLAYETLEDWENTIAYAQKSLHLKKQLRDTLGLARVYGNMANAYYYQKKDSPAVAFFRLARRQYKLLGDSTGMALTAHDLGNLLTEQKQYDSALYYLQSSLDFFGKRREDFLPNYCLALQGLGQAYLQKGNLKEATKLFRSCPTCETEIEDLAYRKALFTTHYAYYKKTGNTVAALKALEQMQAAGDSLSQQSKNFENQRVAIRYEFGRKAEEDSLKYQLKLAEGKKTTAEYRGRMYLLAALALLVASIAGFFYTRSKLNRKRELIARQQAQLSESKALRAQMNPHFIFNCLNTIDSFVLQNKQQDASRLIQRFSKLSRRVLEHTTENYITVQQELETLRIYLEIEQVRKAGQFRFEIDTEPDVLAYLIPPMLLQPFVENAVLHGMKGIPSGEGLIRIEAGKDENCAFFQITDNGIGRRKAMALKAAQPETHKSLSMEITLQRLESLHGHARHDEYIRFTDLEAPLQGTRVRITIPLSTNASC